MHLGARDARKLQQVVDEHRHLFAGGLDPLGIASALLAEVIAVVFEQASLKPDSARNGARRSWETEYVNVSRFRLARSRSSARRPSSAAARTCCCSVMSRAIDDAPISLPSSSRMGETVTDTGTALPSLRLRTVSMVHDTLAPADLVEDLLDLPGPVRGAQDRHRLADDLLRLVPVDPRGGRVPARDHPVDGFPDDGIIRGVDNRREQLDSGNLRPVSTSLSGDWPMTTSPPAARAQIW